MDCCWKRGPESRPVREKTIRAGRNKGIFSTRPDGQCPPPRAGPPLAPLPSRNGQWEGPGGGDLDRCNLHRVHTSPVKLNNTQLHSFSDYTEIGDEAWEWRVKQRTKDRMTLWITLFSTKKSFQFSGQFYCTSCYKDMCYDLAPTFWYNLEPNLLVYWVPFLWQSFWLQLWDFVFLHSEDCTFNRTNGSGEKITSQRWFKCASSTVASKT